MNRRKFITTGSVAAAALPALAAIPSFASAKREAETSPEPVHDFTFEEATIDELQRQMEKGSYSSRDITSAYLKRIKEIDKEGIRLNAVIELNPDALEIATQMDRERKEGKVRSAMHGIPVLIKDNIDTGDKMMTTAGSLALMGHLATQDAFVIKLLREAGAVMLGKTNLSEWANIRSTRSTSGWSSRGGQTKNPYVLDRNPCGSSSGSAVAVAANLCSVAVGTETDGSVTAPASFCGIVGMKPTVGLVSRSGIIPISATQDTAGPMGKTVKDVAILLNAMVGVDSQDSATQASKGNTPKDYSKLDGGALKEKRIGIEKSFFKGHEGVVALYRDAIKTMMSKGAEIIELDFLKPFNDLGEAEFLVLKYELKDGLNKYLSRANTDMKSLTEVIDFNRRNERTVMPYFRQEIFDDADAKGTLNDKAYTDALAKSSGARKMIDETMKSNKLDAICAVTIGPANCIDLVNGDYSTGFYFSPPAAMAGYPHITVPMGKVQELPVGLSFIAGAWKDFEVLNIAYAYEKSTNRRMPPKFIPTLDPK